MFDIGFSELVVIGVVALVVIGPERLPKVARTAGCAAASSESMPRLCEPWPGNTKASELSMSHTRQDWSARQ